MSPERLKKLTLQDGERRATFLTWRFSGVTERRHPRSQIIRLARLRKAEQPRTQPTPRLENRWDGQPGRPPARGTRTLSRYTFDTRNSGSAGSPLSNFTFRPLPEPNDIILVLDPDKPADNQGKD
jgi:hypothetical protein